MTLQIFKVIRYIGINIFSILRYLLNDKVMQKNKMIDFLIKFLLIGQLLLVLPYTFKRYRRVFRGVSNSPYCI